MQPLLTAFMLFGVKPYIIAIVYLKKFTASHL